MLCFPVCCPSASCLLHVRTAYEPRIDVTTLHRALCLPAMPLRIRWGEDESSVRNDGAQGVATQGLRPTRFGEGESSVRYDDAQGVATQGLSPTRLGEDESSVRYDGAQGVATQGRRPTRLGEDESSARYDGV
jgi:hypothetical protein